MTQLANLERARPNESIRLTKEGTMKKQVGDQVTVRDSMGNRVWPTIKGIAKMQAPIPGYEPVLMLVEHADGKKEIYFPYYKTADGKQQFTNRPPMFGEDVWLGLLTDAIRQRFFTKGFLKKLALECVGKLA
jgi:hypothetical protein